MTKQEMLAAVQIEYQKFLAETGIPPEKMSASEKMAFQLGFMSGAQWNMDRTLQIVKELQAQ